MGNESGLDNSPDDYVYALTTYIFRNWFVVH